MQRGCLRGAKETQLRPSGSQVQISPNEIQRSRLVSYEGGQGLSPRSPGTQGKSLPFPTVTFNKRTGLKDL